MPEIFGPYRIVRRVSQSGWCAVDEAVDSKGARRVAIKSLLPSLADDLAATSGFLCEARLMARLAHPGIVKLHDVGVAGGTKYYTMEWIDGRNLFQLMREEGPLEPGRAIGIVRQAAAGLDHAHGKEVVHLGLKPSKVLVCARDWVTLVGFGRLPGRTVGNPRYLAPEVVSGRPDDPRSNLFTLALMLFEMLTGRHPYLTEAGPVEMMRRELAGPAPCARALRGGVPEAVDAALRKALAGDPALRQAGPAEFVEELG